MNKKTYIILLSLLFGGYVNSQTIGIEQYPVTNIYPINPTYSVTKNIKTGETSVGISPLPGIVIKANTETQDDINKKNAVKESDIKLPNIKTDVSEQKKLEDVKLPIINDMTKENLNKPIIEKKPSYIYSESSNTKVDNNNKRLNEEYIKFLNSK